MKGEVKNRWQKGRIIYVYFFVVEVGGSSYFVHCIFSIRYPDHFQLRNLYPFCCSVLQNSTPSLNGAVLSDPEQRQGSLQGNGCTWHCAEAQ